MEATSNKTRETLNENAKAAGKIFNDTNTALMDMYSKQLNLAIGFYTNFLNAAMGGIKNWNQDSSYTDFFQINDGFQNPFLTAFTKISNQLLEYNRNLFRDFNSEAKNNYSDWTEAGKKYKETIDLRLEAYKNIFKSTIEAYNKHLDSSIETNKKMMEDINAQFNSVVKSSQKFWADILNTNNTNKAYSTEEDFRKEPSQGELRRKSNVPASMPEHK